VRESWRAITSEEEVKYQRTALNNNFLGKEMNISKRGGLGEFTVENLSSGRKPDLSLEEVMKGCLGGVQGNEDW